jgi:hypothetical protein
VGQQYRVENIGHLPIFRYPVRIATLYCQWFSRWSQFNGMRPFCKIRLIMRDRYSTFYRILRELYFGWVFFETKTILKCPRFGISFGQILERLWFGFDQQSSSSLVPIIKCLRKIRHQRRHHSQ